MKKRQDKWICYKEIKSKKERGHLQQMRGTDYMYIFEMSTADLLLSDTDDAGRSDGDEMVIETVESTIMNLILTSANRHL